MNALNALNEIETSDVSLQTNFASIFDYTNKGNKEIIFAVRYRDQESGESLPYDQSFLHPQSMPNSKDLDPSTLAVLTGGRGYSYLQVQPQVRSQFDVKDQRRDASFKEIYIYTGGFPAGVKTYYTTIQTKFDGVVISGQRFWYDDYVIYRYWRSAAGSVSVFRLGPREHCLRKAAGYQCGGGGCGARRWCARIHQRAAQWL